MRRGGEETRVAHPSAVLAFRVALYLLVAAVLGALAAGALGYLVLVVALGGTAVLLGTGVDPVGFAVMGGGGLLVAGVSGVALLAAARWLDRRVTAADARPDPVDRVKRRYVAGEIDEAALERGLRAALSRRGLPGDDRRGREAPGTGRAGPGRSTRPVDRDYDDGASREPADEVVESARGTRHRRR